jgi:hypothetical protein
MLKTLRCCKALRQPALQWSGPNHWNVINILHFPNILYSFTSIAIQKSVKNSV